MKNRADPLHLQELDELVLKVLARSQFGLTAAKIRQDLPLAYRSSSKQLIARLDNLLSQGRIHVWQPPNKAGNKPAPPIFSVEPLEALVSNGILELLKLQTLPPAQVKKHLPAHIGRHLPIFLRPLLNNRTVKLHPPLKGKRLLSLLDPDPVVYLTGELKRLFEKGTKLGFSTEAVRQSAQRYLIDQQPNKETVHSPAEVESIIFKAMTSLKPAAARGALVYIPDLRRALREVFRDKESFDRAILQLAGQEKVQLQSHSLPAELTPEEKGFMIDNGRGSYFMAIGIRME
jgi:hypothetical protein